VKIKRKILVLTASLTAVTLIAFAGCTNNSGVPTGSSETASGTTQTAETAYHIDFLSNGQQVVSLGLTELQSLPEVTIDMGGGSPETGPTLQSVLALAGIKDYSSVTIVGMTKGRLATAELTLKQAEVTVDVILDFNNQGKTKLCGKEIPDANWVIDVTEIRAE
jgi:hypothetical protein